MEIREMKKKMRTEIGIFSKQEDKFDREYLENKMNNIFDSWEREKKLPVNQDIRKRIIKELCDDFLGYGPLQILLSDQEITEIMINSPRQIYIEKSGKKMLTDVEFDDHTHLRYIIERMLTPTARRVDESSPYVDFSLEDGSRVNIIIPPLSVGSPAITIRKMLTSIEKIEDLIGLNTIDERMAKFLVACIKANINILFSGPTGSGKTTTLEVLSSYINPQERIVTLQE